LCLEKRENIESFLGCNHVVLEPNVNIFLISDVLNYGIYFETGSEVSSSSSSGSGSYSTIEKKKIPVFAQNGTM
jgi:hypothetical protein